MKAVSDRTRIMVTYGQYYSNVTDADEINTMLTDGENHVYENEIW